jgi:hypothetical protein
MLNNKNLQDLTDKLAKTLQERVPEFKNDEKSARALAQHLVNYHNSSRRAISRTLRTSALESLGGAQDELLDKYVTDTVDKGHFYTGSNEYRNFLKGQEPTTVTTVAYIAYLADDKQPKSDAEKSKVGRAKQDVANIQKHIADLNGKRVDIAHTEILSRIGLTKPEDMNGLSEFIEPDALGAVFQGSMQEMLTTGEISGTGILTKLFMMLKPVQNFIADGMKWLIGSIMGHDTSHIKQDRISTKLVGKFLDSHGVADKEKEKLMEALPKDLSANRVEKKPEQEGKKDAGGAGVTGGAPKGADPAPKKEEPKQPEAPVITIPPIPVFGFSGVTVSLGAPLASPVTPPGSPELAPLPRGK